MMSSSKSELHLKLQIFGRVLHTAEPDFCELQTLAPIQCLSFDYITYDMYINYAQLEVLSPSSLKIAI